MSNEKNTSQITTNPYSKQTFSAITSDGIFKEFKSDFVIQNLTEDQFKQWKTEVEKQESEYFLEKTIGVTMTQDQHDEIDTFIKETFSSLNQENNFETEYVKINFTTHFIDRIRTRKRKKVKTSFKHRAELREYVSKFNNVEKIFRWNDSGLSYRLTNNKINSDPTSLERLAITIRLSENGEEIIIDITFITFITKKLRRKKVTK